MNIIRVTKYDPVKGLGEYYTPKGESISFRYFEFAGKFVPGGKLARLIDGKIYHAKKFDILFWFIRRLLKWLS